MLSFLLPFASKIVSDAVSKIPDDAELGEKTNRSMSSDLEESSQTHKKLTWMISFLSKLRSQFKHAN